jgi:hypothetical protein
MIRLVYDVVVAEKKDRPVFARLGGPSCCGQNHLTFTVAILPQLPKEQTVEIRRGLHSGKRAEYDTLSAFPQTTVERIAWTSPYPILRHHFGLSTIEKTMEGQLCLPVTGMLEWDHYLPPTLSSRERGGSVGDFGSGETTPEILTYPPQRTGDVRRA